MTAAATVLALPTPAPAQPAAAPWSTEPRIEVSDELPERPAGYAITAREAIRIANRDPNVLEARARPGRLRASAEARAPDGWQVGYFDGGREVVQVIVDAEGGSVRESWTGYQVAWEMARGYEGSFGHLLNAPYVWLPLCAIFLLGLVDWRRPWRVVHLDLLVLLAFGASHFFFNRAEIGLSVPLVYPVLAYLLARMLWVGFRGRGAGLNPTAPIAWLAIAAAFLVGFRIAVNIADSGVIDVGYSGVIGADRIVDGDPLYGEGAFPDDNPFGDTYGPVNYLLYVPLEQALPWSGSWDELPAAHGAAIFLDLAAIGLLLALGRRLRPGRAGRDLGVVLAFAWAAFPYTAFVLQSNANDTLVAALVLAAFVVSAAPLRGAMAAVAAATKFGPLGLAPLLARGLDLRARAVASFGLGFVIVAALVLAEVLLDPGLATFWDRTVGSQAGRDSPFSVWGQEPGLEWLQTAVKAGTVALAALVAIVPRRRDLARMLALGAAVMIAVQLTTEHWFYLYIVWFFPLAIAALAAIPSARAKPEPPPGEPLAGSLSSGEKRPAPAVSAGAVGTT